MTSLAKQSLVPPTTVGGIMRANWQTQIVKTAAELQLFDALAGGTRDAKAVAEGSGIDLRAAELLLNALASIQLVDKKADKYTLSEESQTYLVSKSPLYMGRYLQIQKQLAMPWMHLTDLAKSGRPYAEVNKDAKAEEFFPELAASLFAWNYANATEVVEAIDVASLVKSSVGKSDERNFYRVLDLACGSAVWSIPAAKVSPKVKVDALDFPAVLEIAKEFTGKNDVASQYSYLAGNWKDVKLEEGVYDLVFLGHILHSEGHSRSRELLDAVYRATTPGGSLIVAEFTTDDTRSNPPFGAMFAVNMFVLTTEGCVFTDNELDSVIREAGFSGIERIAEDPVYATVVHAVKK